MNTKKYIAQLRHKYLLTISNDHTFEKYFSIKLSKLNLLSLFLTFSLLIAAFIVAIITFTDFKQFIPGFDKELRQKIVTNAMQVDSLKYELQKRDRFLTSIQKVIKGEDQVTLEAKPINDSLQKASQNVTFKTSKAETEFRTIIEEQERFNLHVDTDEKKANTDQKFFPPLDGIISQKFDPKVNHYGIDLVAKQNSRISTVLNGTVIFAGWTVRTGYVITIQHDNNTISIYKHNAVLLKQIGNHVKAGEAIAILGNTGELTTSEHLHFELWKNGKALDPELFIKFK